MGATPGYPGRKPDVWRGQRRKGVRDLTKVRAKKRPTITTDGRREKINFPRRFLAPGAPRPRGGAEGEQNGSGGEGETMKKRIGGLLLLLAALGGCVAS